MEIGTSNSAMQNYAEVCNTMQVMRSKEEAKQCPTPWAQKYH